MRTLRKLILPLPASARRLSTPHVSLGPVSATPNSTLPFHPAHVAFAEPLITVAEPRSSSTSTLACRPDKRDGTPASCGCWSGSPEPSSDSACGCRTNTESSAKASPPMRSKVSERDTHVRSATLSQTRAVNAASKNGEMTTARLTGPANGSLPVPSPSGSSSPDRKGAGTSKTTPSSPATRSLICRRRCADTVVTDRPGKALRKSRSGSAVIVFRAPASVSSRRTTVSQLRSKVRFRLRHTTRCWSSPSGERKRTAHSFGWNSRPSAGAVTSWTTSSRCANNGW